MRLEANRKTRVAYCLTLFQITIIPFAFGVFTNMASALRSPMERMDYIIRTVLCLLLLIPFGYRIFAVFRKSETLVFISDGSVVRSIRTFGIFLMWIGALAVPSLVVGLGSVDIRAEQ